MTMKAILYLSTNTTFENELDIQNMIVKAQEQNMKNDITGYLYYSNGNFVQYFEGEETQVEHLWKNIQNDARHKITYVTESHLESRKFNTWYMRDWTSSTRVESFLNEYLAEQMEYLSNKPENTGLLSNLLKRSNKVWTIVDNIRDATSPTV